MKTEYKEALFHVFKQSFFSFNGMRNAFKTWNEKKVENGIKSSRNAEWVKEKSWKQHFVHKFKGFWSVGEWKIWNEKFSVKTEIKGNSRAVFRCLIWEHVGVKMSDENLKHRKIFLTIQSKPKICCFRLRQSSWETELNYKMKMLEINRSSHLTEKICILWKLFQSPCILKCLKFFLSWRILSSLRQFAKPKPSFTSTTINFTLKLWTKQHLSFVKLN